MVESKAWYAAGLHFECQKCGNCCAGPEEGYIWISGPEIELLADHLHLSNKQLDTKYLTHYGPRISLRERRSNHDCIFLKNSEDGRGCGIYPVRPNQCRTWPFWTSNLRSPEEWKRITRKCPGIGRGKLYRYEQIEALRLLDRWWPPQTPEIVARVEAIYQNLDSQMDSIRTFRQGTCRACGKCCDFAQYDHRLFVSTPEQIYFRSQVGDRDSRRMRNGRCPYMEEGRCGIHLHRFAGCRIFFCDPAIDPAIQAELSEWAVRQFKELCTEMNLNYRYCDLKMFLNGEIS